MQKGRVTTFYCWGTLLLQLLAIAIAIAKTVLFWSCYFIFFPPQIFRHPWADFRETLPHDGCVLKYFISYVGVHTCHLKMDGRKPQFWRFSYPKSTLWAPPFPSAKKIWKSKTIGSICGYVRTPCQTWWGPPAHLWDRLSHWCGGGEVNFESI